MRLDALRLSVASALAFAVIWALCSALVWGAPGMSIMAAQGMMHANPPMAPMMVTPAGFIVGLVGWSIVAGVTGGLVALIYNGLDRSSAGKA